MRGEFTRRLMSKNKVAGHSDKETYYTEGI